MLREQWGVVLEPALGDDDKSPVSCQSASQPELELELELRHDDSPLPRRLCQGLAGAQATTVKAGAWFFLAAGKLPEAA